MIATTEEYIKALLQVRKTRLFENKKYILMLKAQYSSPNHTITATQLADAAGYANYNAANLYYGSLGRAIAEALNYEPPKHKNGDPAWFFSISTDNKPSEDTIDGHYEFVMRTEFAEALKQMKWVK